MSFKFQNGVWPIPLRAACKSVLLALADHARDKAEGKYAVGEAWPSIRTIVEMTGVSKRSVQRELDHLLTAGLVHTPDRAGGRHQQTTHYFVHPDIAAGAFGRMPTSKDAGHSLDQRRALLAKWVRNPAAAAAITLAPETLNPQRQRPLTPQRTGAKSSADGCQGGADGCQGGTQTLTYPSTGSPIPATLRAAANEPGLGDRDAVPSKPTAENSGPKAEAGAAPTKATWPTRKMRGEARKLGVDADHVAATIIESYGDPPPGQGDDGPWARAFYQVAAAEAGGFIDAVLARGLDLDESDSEEAAA